MPILCDERKITTCQTRAAFCVRDGLVFSYFCATHLLAHLDVKERMVLRLPPAQAWQWQEESHQDN